MNTQMKKFLAIAFIAATILSCGPFTTPATNQPGETPGTSTSYASLEREVREVYHQTGSQNEYEVTSLANTSPGDQVRTVKSGRALLKWPDLYVRLYSDPKNPGQMKYSNATPAWLTLALDTGLALSSGKAQPGQRLAFTTGNARVEIVGTTLMIAYHPGKQITIVRVLNGQAQVQNASGSSLATVNAKEWAQVGGAGNIQVSQDLSEMRKPAASLDMLDLFRQVETDIQNGFGPDSSRFLAQNCSAGVLYCESFDSSLAPGWYLDPGWQVEQDAGNYVLSGNGHVWATLIGQAWSDYRVRFRLKLTSGVVHLNYRMNDGPIRYFIEFSEGDISISRQVKDQFTLLTGTQARHGLNVWHVLEIAGWGGHIQVYVDGNLELDYRDPNPIQAGSIAFETLDNSRALVDDIVVLGSGSETGSAPATPPLPAATSTLTREPEQISTPTLIPTLTPTLNPTLMPTRIETATQATPLCPAGVIYCENFNSFQLSKGWQLGKGWQVVREGKNGILEGRTHDWATLTGFTWDNHRVHFNLNLIEGNIHLVYRMVDGPTRYFYEFRPDGVTLTRQNGDVFTDLARVSAAYETNHWYTIDMVGWGGRLQFLVDGNLVLDAIDQTPILRGSIAFETLDKSIAQIDNIEISPSGEEPKPAVILLGREVNADRAGADYANFDVQGNYEACQDACRNDPLCVAYTYVKQAFGMPAPHCWLKAGAPAAVSNSCCVSGTKTYRPYSLIQILELVDRIGPAIGPLISYPDNPSLCVETDNKVTVSSLITDKTGVYRAELWSLFIPYNGVGVWTQLPMIREGDNFANTITDLSSGNLTYFIRAWDDLGNTADSPKDTKSINACVK